MSRARLLFVLLVAGSGCAHGWVEDEAAREKWCREVVESPSSRPDQVASCQRFLNDRAPKRTASPPREVIRGWKLARASAQ